MSHQQLTNPEGAFGYATTAGLGGNQRSDITVRVLRNMSTASAVAVGQPVAWSTLIGDGNEVIPVTTVLTARQRFAGIAITSATTNAATGTSFRSSEHPRGAWCKVVVEGPADAWVTSAVEKGDNLVQSNDTANGVTWGKLGAVTSAVPSATTGLVYGLGWALTTATSATTNRSRVYVKPFVFHPVTS